VEGPRRGGGQWPWPKDGCVVETERRGKDAEW